MTTSTNLARPDPDVLFNQYLAEFQTTVLGGAPVIPESPEWYVVSLHYAMATTFYAFSEQTWKERDPRQACEASLIELAAKDGVYPRPAQPAQGYVLITGVAGAALPSPIGVTIGGVDFVTADTNFQPTQVPASGSFALRVVALQAGTEGNITDTTGNLSAAIVDVNTAVDVCSAFNGGTDAETVEAFRTRYIERLRFQPRATVAWMQSLIESWPGVSQAVQRTGSCCSCSCHEEYSIGSANTSTTDECAECCGCLDCGGKMDFYVLFGDDTKGVLNNNVETLTEIQTWLFGSPQGYGLGQVEIGVCGRLFTWTDVGVTVRIIIEDCASTASATRVEEIVQDYFTTIGPSQSVSTEDIRLAVGNVLGITVDAELVFDDESVLYGDGVAQTSSSATATVFTNGCKFEPDCDYRLVVNAVSVTTPTSETFLGGCP